MTKRSATVLTVATVGVIGAGAAWAAWTVTSTGQAQASAVNSVAQLQVTSVSSPGLAPGATVDVKFHVANPNAFPVVIHDIDFTDITASGDCNAGSVTFVEEAAMPTTGLELAANGSSDITYARSLHMDNTAEDSCIGATFSFNVVLDAQSNAS
ncbi:hypothetical protein BJY16_000812 [Actinoplanes octamycinicus]|uniref:Camelysin-like metallo-endopeptidase n=1 Tax=Actinoplanes octamycinicus TaxID=135948 RepID=A0A7W7GS93_9ACTN|nr:hypothetical protein [Actinoplanes octamycinicus]MBB4737353.1 hypothetical protein [Actinoplanes octamycinicus]